MTSIIWATTLRRLTINVDTLQSIPLLPCLHTCFPFLDGFVAHWDILKFLDHWVLADAVLVSNDKLVVGEDACFDIGELVTMVVHYAQGVNLSSNTSCIEGRLKDLNALVDLQCVLSAHVPCDHIHQFFCFGFHSFFKCLGAIVRGMNDCLSA